MFCPRCGRSVSETSNFCGGCGLSRAEIEKYIVKTEPQAEAAQPQPEVKAEPQTVSWESAPAQEAPKAESFAETKAEEARDIKSTEYHYSYKTATESQPKAEPSYSYTTADSVQAEPKAETKAEYSYAEPVKEVKNENLSTVDFIWMMIISGIPVVGLVYLIYLAFQNDNTNKRSYARASLIVSIFASVIGIVFFLGFMLSAV